ncbi:hypothetical protein SAMN05216203_2815 [Marinobacter daqiaonensis]|uniref:Uncharacterized protein n=1 Tax=Marinobacter daqiaonensis TaxID=650891 RepID=A0A1I6J9V3_9GAMM|nr:hypothetical protein [Marinobacter daqiaonensis]SFR75739.1 hypothetical protein SAMN05216203_2815 [Marinobacter daqiaonensis]
MTTLFIILALLFLALLVIVPLLEKHADKGDAIDDRRLSRWILPLIALMLVLALIRHYVA